MHNPLGGFTSNCRHGAQPSARHGYNPQFDQYGSKDGSSAIAARRGPFRPHHGGRHTLAAERAVTLTGDPRNRAADSDREFGEGVGRWEGAFGCGEELPKRALVSRRIPTSPSNCGILHLTLTQFTALCARYPVDLVRVVRSCFTQPWREEPLNSDPWLSL